MSCDKSEVHNNKSVHIKNIQKHNYYIIADNQLYIDTYILMLITYVLLAMSSQY